MDIKSLKNNNKGASLVIIIAVMALFMVLAVNILMAANVTSNNMGNEYDYDNINLYISSVYRVIDEKICNGEIDAIFDGAGDDIDSANIIDIDGFVYKGKSCNVSLKSVKYGINYGEVFYTLTIDGKEYTLIGRYLLNKVNGKTTIKSDGCSGIEGK